VADNLIDAYWETVHVCLTDLHGVDARSALLLVQRLRAADADDNAPQPHIGYHREPFDVACALVDRDLDALEFQDIYRAIRSRTRLDDPRLPFVLPEYAGTLAADGGARRPDSPGAHGKIGAARE